MGRRCHSEERELESHRRPKPFTCRELYRVHTKQEIHSE